MQKIAKKHLIEAYNKFDCNQWKNEIKSLLENNLFSNDNDLIEIPNEKLYLIKDNNQIKYVESLGLNIIDSKLEEAKKDLLEVFNQCHLVLKEKPIFFNQMDEWMFEIDSKNGHFWYSYYRIYQFFGQKYGYNEQQINDLITSVLLHPLKIEGITPIILD